MTFRSRSRPGALLLITVLTVGSVLLTVGLVIGLRGIREASNGLGTVESQRVLSVADSCMEDTLLHLKRVGNYTGPGVPLSVAGGTCTVSISTSGTDRTITIVADVGAYTRTLTATAVVTPPVLPETENTITVTAWRISTL